MERFVRWRNQRLKWPRSPKEKICYNDSNYLQALYENKSTNQFVQLRLWYTNCPLWRPQKRHRRRRKNQLAPESAGLHPQQFCTRPNLTWLHLEQKQNGTHREDSLALENRQRQNGENKEEGIRKRCIWGQWRPQKWLGYHQWEVFIQYYNQTQRYAGCGTGL